MKYAINTSRDGYQSITYNTKINFVNDILYFKNIKEAYRFLYYAKTNRFEIEVTKNLTENIHLLKIIIAHGGKIKLIQTHKNVKKSIKQISVEFLMRYMECRLNQVNFQPTLKNVQANGKQLYLLDGYVVNDINWDFEGTLVNGIYNMSKLPFKSNIVSDELKVEIVEEKYLFGTNAEITDYSIYENEIKKTPFIPKVFVYSVKKVKDGIEASIFYQGYEYFQQEFKLECNSEFEIRRNDDLKYYSKNSECFKESFKTILFKRDKIEFGFKYENKVTKMILARHLQSTMIYNDLYIENFSDRLVIDSNIETYKSIEYRQYEEMQKINIQEIYLFNDRQDSADDNAEALYRYYMKNTTKNIWFAVSRKCSSWNRLKQEGFNLVDFGSDEHKKIYLNASKVISSHAARRIYDPFYPSKEFVNLERRKFIFLQHGIIMGKHHGFLDKVNNPLDLIISSTNEEAKLIKEFSGYENVAITGLARYDNYVNNENNEDRFIVYAPSWNVLYKDNLQDSKYVREIEKVLNSKVIHNMLQKENITLKLIMHPEFINENIKFRNPYNYKILKQEEFLYSDVLKNTMGLITDYSSLLFDILYQKKLVIEHQPYELHHENDILAGYQEAMYTSRTIDELEKILETIEKHNFKLEDSKHVIINHFFDFKDDRNCMRIYNMIEKII